MFPALLRYWRTRRGLSQLDLAIAADVSSRHVSYLETGRSRPSPEMVRRLMATLSVPLRAVDEALRAAGHPAAFTEQVPDRLPESVERTLERMMTQQEPYPLTMLAPDSTILRANAVGAVFSQPGLVSVEELRVESWFPLDDATAAACGRLVG